MNNKAKPMTTKQDRKAELKPKLRFPEFLNQPEWEIMRLSEICTIACGGTPSRDEAKYWGGDVPWISSKYFSENGQILSQEFITKAGLRNSSAAIAPKGSTLMVSRVSVGKYAFADKDYAINQDITSLTPKGEVSQKFLFSLAWNIASEIVNSAVGTGIKGVTQSFIAAICVTVPAEKEQQRIADCLISLADLTCQQTQKLHMVKRYRKGLVQKLFPREGDPIPRLRFREFRGGPEWVAKRLGQIATYENGKAHENNISEDGQYTVVNSKFISTEGEVRKYSNDAFCIAESGDVLMVLSDVPNGKAIAKCYYVEADNLYTVNQRICKIKPTGINGQFLYYVLDRNPFFLAFDDGVKQTNLRKEDVLNCPVCFPESLEEQKKIADLISSIDELIAAQTQKLDALKDHRKGLMQQLFPSPTEAEA